MAAAGDAGDAGGGVGDESGEGKAYGRERRRIGDKASYILVEDGPTGPASSVSNSHIR